MPVGSIITYWGDENHFPSGFLVCDGKTRKQIEYPDLVKHFTKVSPNMLRPRGEFIVPDLRGEFIRGLDAGRGVDPNRNLGSLQSDEFKKHRHYFGHHEGPATGITGAWPRLWR